MDVPFMYNETSGITVDRMSSPGAETLTLSTP
jgi:hypothetical protein